MAADRSILIQGLIELHLAGKGGEEAVASMTKIVAQAKEVEKATGTMGAGTAKATEGVGKLEQAFTSLGKTVASYFAARAVANFLVDSYIGFARTERQAIATERQIKALGQSAQGAGFRDFIAQLSRTSGILDDDLVPAFQRAFGAFKDYKASAELVTIASKFAAAGIGDVASNVDAISRFFQTGSARGLVQFGVDIKAGADGTISLVEGLKAFKDQASTLGGPIEDAQSDINALKGAWDDLGDSIGSALGKVVKFFREARRSSDQAFIEELRSADKKNLTARQRAWVEEFELREQARIDAFFKEETELEAATRLFAAKQLEREKEQNEKKAEAAVKAENDRLEKVVDLNAETETNLLKQRISFYEKGSSERIALELELNRKLEAAAIANAKSILAKKTDIAKLFAAQRGDILASKAEDPAVTAAREHATAFDPRADFDEIERAYAEHEAEMTRIFQDASGTRDETAESSAQLRAKLERDAIASYLTVAGSVASSLAAVFEDNKAVQYAAAIINTAAAVMKTYAEYGGTPFGIAAAIAVAAQGAAQIAIISKTKIGSSGSSSSPGIASPPTTQASAPASVSASQSVVAALSGRGVLTGGTTINIGTAFGDRQSMVKLAREIERVNRNNQSVLR